MSAETPESANVAPTDDQPLTREEMRALTAGLVRDGVMTIDEHYAAMRNYQPSGPADVETRRQQIMAHPAFYDVNHREHRQVVQRMRELLFGGGGDRR